MTFLCVNIKPATDNKTYQSNDVVFLVSFSDHAKLRIDRPTFAVKNIHQEYSQENISPSLWPLFNSVHLQVTY